MASARCCGAAVFHNPSGPLSRVILLLYPDLFFSPCSLGKGKENHPKKQGFMLSAKPVESLGKTGKRSKKQGNSLQRKKKKARKSPQNKEIPSKQGKENLGSIGHVCKLLHVCEEGLS